ncbi:hypothetical protein AgCh_004766 [Apium graveolens]
MKKTDFSQVWFESTSKRAKGPKAGSEPDFKMKVKEQIKKRLIAQIGSRVPAPKRTGEFGLSVHRSGGSICSGVELPVRPDILSQVYESPNFISGSVCIPGEIMDPNTIPALSKFNKFLLVQRYEFFNGTIQPDYIQLMQGELDMTTSISPLLFPAKLSWMLNREYQKWYIDYAKGLDIDVPYHDCIIAILAIGILWRNNRRKSRESFGTSMSTHHILGLKKVPRVRLFADSSGTSTGQLSWYGRTAAPREILLYTSSRTRFLNRTSIGERCQLHSSNLYKGLSPPLTKRWFYPGQATKAGDLGGNSERKRRGRSGVEEWSTHQAHDLKTAGSNPVPA